MSYSLQDMLTQYAIESGLVEAEPTTDEITVVTSETVTELENEIDEISDKITETNTDVDQVVKATDAILATEAMIIGRMNRICDPEVSGQYTRLTQELTWAGVVETMEAYKFPKSIYAELTDGMSFESDEPAAQAQADSKKGDSILKKLWAMLVSAFERMKALGVRFLDLFRTSNSKNKRSVEILAKEIANRSTTLKNADAKISNSSWKTLIVNGKVDPAGAIKMIDAGYTEHLAKAQVAVKETVVKVGEILKRGNASGKEGVIDAILKALNVRKGDAVESSKVLNAFLDSFPKDFSFNLPAGRKAAYTLVRKSTGASEIKFEITKIPEGFKTDGEHNAPALSEIEALVKLLSDNIEVIEGMNKSIEDNIKATDEVLASAKALAAKPGATDAEAAPLRAITTAASALVGSTKTFLPPYNQFALTIGHDAYKYGLKVASMYEKKGKEKKADEKKADEKPAEAAPAAAE